MLPMKRINADRKHPLYWTWNSIFVRCYYKSHKQYKDYGGKGIQVYSEWFDFESFVADVEDTIGKRPSKKHSLDRMDCSDNYIAYNLRWATRRQQARNKYYARD